MKDETEYHMNPNRWHKLGWTFDHYKQEKRLGKEMYKNVMGAYDHKDIEIAPKPQNLTGEEKLRLL
jgi:hypothetical protein